VIGMMQLYKRFELDFDFVRRCVLVKIESLQMFPGAL
jgi:hypothetical protein